MTEEGLNTPNWSVFNIWWSPVWRVASLPVQCDFWLVLLHSLQILKIPGSCWWMLIFSLIFLFYPRDGLGPLPDFIFFLLNSSSWKLQYVLDCCVFLEGSLGSHPHPPDGLKQIHLLFYNLDSDGGVRRDTARSVMLSPHMQSHFSSKQRAA